MVKGSHARIGIVEIDKIKEMYAKGLSYSKIAEELGCSHNAICHHVKALRELGVLEPRKVTRVVHREKSFEAKEAEKKTQERKAAKIEREKEPKYGVWCDLKTSKKCKYGSQSEQRLDGPKCNYLLMTDKARTVMNRQSGYNDPHHCFCFEPKEGRRTSKMALHQRIENDCYPGGSRR